MKIHPILSALLLPASWLYQAGVRSRTRKYNDGRLAPSRVDAIVISVGNLTVGGTGKTPMVMWLAERLTKVNEPVAILSRGYVGLRGKLNRKLRNGVKGEVRSNRALWSDEVQLMSRRLGPAVLFGVGAKRREQARILAGLGVKWFILDDGFQHRQLHRDVDIVLVDASNPFGNRRLLPAGPLREPPEALGRADVVVMTRVDSSPELEANLRAYTAAPIFFGNTVLAEVRHLSDISPKSNLRDLATKRVLAFCGIGNPDAFFRDVQGWGMELVGTCAFRDHHTYTQADVGKVERAAARAGADAIVCTQKDDVNLHLGRGSFEKFSVFSCDVTMRVADGERFWQTILDVIEAKRRQT